MPAVISKASGKTILFGEHAVVYSYPAIAVPVNAIQVKISILPRITESNSLIRIRNTNWKEDILFVDMNEDDPIHVSIVNIGNLVGQKFPSFELTISSSIPIAAGLGSSAALSVAIIKGFSQFLGLKLTNDEINALAYQSEINQHGSPSGIDNSVIAYGQPIIFKKGQPIKRIAITNELHLVLADSNERSMTKEVVEFVKTKLDKKPNEIRSVLDEIGKITEEAAIAISQGDIQAIGALMTRNHLALQKLGVSTPTLDHLVGIANSTGALGAKLCGAGKGGYMVAICNHQDIEKIGANLIKEGARNIIKTTIGKSN